MRAGNHGSLLSANTPVLSYPPLHEKAGLEIDYSSRGVLNSPSLEGLRLPVP